MRALEFVQRRLLVRTRLPLGEGTATVRRAPHVVVFGRFEHDGRQTLGVAAETLAPRWFLRRADQGVAVEQEAMQASIDSACRIASWLRDAPQPWAWSEAVHEEQRQWAEAAEITPLLAELGPSLVERAMLDAWCRLRAEPFPVLARRDDLGVPRPSTNGLPGSSDHWPTSIGAALPATPSRRLAVRHTVGLHDPLRDRDVRAGDPAAGPPPRSLAATLHELGVRALKVTLRGDAEADGDRLGEIASIVLAHGATNAQPSSGRGPVLLTLDGAERFEGFEAFQDYWARLAEDRTLRTLMEGLVCVEQPWQRDIALDPTLLTRLRTWRDRPPITIDASDDRPDAAAAALRGGYAGVTHRGAKGVLRGLQTRWLVEAWNLAGAGRGPRHLQTAEDLASLGPIGMNQELTVAATLGLSHAERCGHHVVHGLGHLPRAWRAAAAIQQPDLYAQSPAGEVELRIERGELDLGTTLAAPFGVPWLPIPQALPDDDVGLVG